MKKVKLVTATGELVAHVFIPDFLTGKHPDCLVWGARFFFYKGNTSVYYEGFALVAVSVAPTGNVSGDQPGATVEKGNDELLYGQPKTLEEACGDYLVFFSKAKDWQEMLSLKEDSFVGRAHFGSGAFLRNSLFLWWQSNHGFKDWPESRPPIVTYFNELGITHADDMSGMILTTAYRMHHKLPILEHEQVAYYKAHWKKEGFPDGIFKPNR